jgi:hypothetical protein
MNEVDLASLRILNRRFVSLGWVDCETDGTGDAVNNPRVFCASGFVIEYEGEWLWVTAGHLLNRLDNELPKINRRMRNSQLIAGWNSENSTVRRIAFDYGACVKWYVDDDDEGTDLGIIHLPERVRQALMRAAVAPLHTLELPKQAYDQYLVHGLPKMEQQDDIEASEEGIDCTAEVMPVLFRVFPLESGTGGFRATNRQRFYASVPAEVPLQTLDGVSGGPIYALKLQENRFDCYLAAVQNAERRISRTIAACPSTMFRELLATGFEDIKRRIRQ